MPDATKARLVLVAPPRIDAGFLPLFEAALGAGATAAVLIGGETEEAAEAAAIVLVPIAQAAGAAALVIDHSRVAGRAKADGLHVEAGGEALAEAVRRFKPKGIVGAGRLATRHAAMEAGERDIDYCFFGRPYGDTHAGAQGKMLDLAAWWIEVAKVPAVVMAGSAIESVADAAATGAEFVALGRAVWEHPAGPFAAMGEASALAAAMVPA